jgi:hypothetical protein
VRGSASRKISLELYDPSDWGFGLGYSVIDREVDGFQFVDHLDACSITRSSTTEKILGGVCLDNASFV